MSQKCNSLKLTFTGHLS